MSKTGHGFRAMGIAVMLIGLSGVLAGMTGCAHAPGAVPAYTATATATLNPELPPTQARPEANTRAETQARDQIMAQAAQTRLPNGGTLEDLAVTDTTVRAQLFDTVRDAHVTDRNITPEGVFTITLSLDKSAVQRIVDDYQRRAGK